MTLKAAMLQNWMLTTNLLHDPASFKYYLFPKIINLTLEALFLCIFGKVPREEAGAQRPFDIFLKLYKDSRIQASLKITTKSRKGTLLEITRLMKKKSLPYLKLLE